MTPARDADGNLVLLLADEATGKTYVGTKEGLTPIPKSDVQVDDLGIARRRGLHDDQGHGVRGDRPRALELHRADRGRRRDPARGPRRGDRARADAPVRRRERPVHPGLERHGVRDNGRGSFVAKDGEELEPGWKTTVGFRNFSKIIHNPLDPRSVPARLRVDVRVRVPLRRGSRSRSGSSWRSCSTSRDALPARLPDRCSSSRTRSRASCRSSSGQGLLNDDFGVVNKILAHRRPVALRPELGEGLGDPRQRLADVPVLLPRLARSAPVDPRRADRGRARRRRRPLAGVPEGDAAAAPHRGRAAPDRVVRLQLQQLRHIYLLTGGGPQSSDQSDRGRHGHPDQLHVQARVRVRQGQDYALASAVSIIIFLLIAEIAAIGFWRTKQLENVR